MTEPRGDEILDGLAGDERDRLARVHELLLRADAPPELPPGLAEAPAPPDAEIVPLPRRHRFTALAAAVLAALTLLGAGYLLGGGRGPESAVKKVPMTGAGGAAGELVVYEKDAAGNWPMQLTVHGLPRLPKGYAYELWLTRDGAPAEQCGTFVVAAGETVVRLNAPYRLGDFTGWIVRTGLGPGSTVLATETV